MTLDIMDAINPNPRDIISLVRWSVRLNAHSLWLNFAALKGLIPSTGGIHAQLYTAGPTTNIGFTRNDRMTLPHGFYYSEHFITLSMVLS